MSAPRARDDLILSEEANGLSVQIEGGDNAHFLNSTAAAILLMCDGRHSLNQIACHLRALFPAGENALEEVSKMLQTFDSVGFLHDSGRPQPQRD